MNKRFSLFALALACSSITAFANDIVQCSISKMATDGALIKFTVTQNVEGSYNLVKESFGNSFHGSWHNKKVLGENLRFQCSDDRRPVDGILNEFILDISADSGKHSLVHHTSWQNGFIGDSGNKTETLSDGLTCKKM